MPDTRRTIKLPKRDIDFITELLFDRANGEANGVWQSDELDKFIEKCYSISERIYKQVNAP